MLTKGVTDCCDKVKLLEVLLIRLAREEIALTMKQPQSKGTRGFRHRSMSGKRNGWTPPMEQ